MGFIHLYCQWIFLVTFTVGLNPQQNVNIIIKDSNVTFTWTRPSGHVYVIFTRLDIFNTTKVITTDVTIPETSYTTTVLSPCTQYTVKLRRRHPLFWSDIVTRTFWVTDNVFTSDISTDVNLTWTTGLNDSYIVNAPSIAIYTVTGGNFFQNSKNTNHKVYNYDLHQIHVSVLNVKQNDSGLYTTKSTANHNVDGCCLLVITDKPIKPQLTYNKHPFVGFQTAFTCKSKVRRWPSDPASSLFYTFPAIGEQHNNTLTINVTKSDKGKTVDCNTTDDKRKQSDSSNAMILDPYYGPVDVAISPSTSCVNVTEGGKLNPINCYADCNPNCTYVWEYNTAKIIEGQILKIDKVTRTDSGIYRCRVTHTNSTIRPTYPNGDGRFLVIDVNVNILYSPSIRRFQIRKGTSSFQEYRQKYQLNEEDHVYVKMYIKSNPISHLYFYQQSYSKTELKYNMTYSNYTAELPSLKCEDSGQYTIEANNFIKNSTIRTVELVIQCKPKNIKTEKQTIGLQINALKNVTITVVANPEPKVQWLNNTGLPWKMEQSGTNYNYKLTSAVQIEDESQFGRYYIEISNTAGTEIVDLILVPTDKPQPPLHVSFVYIFVNKAYLSWVAGFDGGEKQSFFIKYKQSRERSFMTIDLKQTGIEKDTALSYTFTGLTPNTSYDVYVIAKNIRGERNKSTEFTTLDAPVPVPVDKSGDTQSDKIYTLVGVVGFLVVIIAAFAIRCLCRHKPSRNNFAAQENRRELGNEIYMSLNRIDSQNDNHEDTSTELVEPGNANGSKAVDNLVAQSNRRKTGNTSYMLLNRTDLQNDNHKDNDTDC